MAVQSSGTILIVNHAGPGQGDLTGILEQAAYRVRRCETVEQAVRLVEEKLDLIVLDLAEPRPSLGEIHRQINVNPILAPVPTLYLAANTRERGAMRRKGRGKDRWLAGPLRAEELLQAIGALRGPQAARATTASAPERTAKKQSPLSEADLSRQIIDSSQDCITLLDLEGKLLSINRGGQCLCEIDRIDPYLNTPWANLWKVEDRATVCEAIGQAQEGKTGRFQAESPSSKGRLIWWDVVISPVLDAEGKTQYLLAISRDITERKESEQALRESEEKYRALIQAAGSIIVRLDREGRLTFVNEYAQEFFGYAEAELLGRPIIGTLVPERESTGRDLARMMQNILQHADQYSYNENEGRCKDGRRVWVAWNNRPIYGPDGKIREILGVGLDITQRKQSEESLRQIEWLLTKSARRDQEGERTRIGQRRSGEETERTDQLILDTIGEEVLTNIVCDSLDLLDTAATVSEKSGECILGIFSASWCQFLDQISRDACKTKHDQEGAATEHWIRRETCWGRASKVASEIGELVDIPCAEGMRLFAVPIWAGDETVGSLSIGYGDPPKDPEQLRRLAQEVGVPLEELQESANRYETRPQFMIELAKSRMQTSAELIGALIQARRAEEALRNSELKMGAIVDTAVDGIITINELGTIESVNHAAERVFGYPAEEMIGHNINVLMPNPYHDEHDKYLENYRRTGQRKIIGIGREVVGRRKDGSTFPLDLSVSEVKLGGRRIFTGLVRDITDRKRAEEALRESERQYRMVTEVIPQLVWTGLADGRADYFNARWLDYTGMTIEEALGDPWAEVVHPDDLARSSTKWTKAARQGSEFQVEERLRGANGSYRWFLVRALPLRSDRGQIIRWFGTCTDIEDRKRAEEALKKSEEQLSLAAEAAGIGHWHWDLIHRRLTWTAKCKELFGLAPEAEITFERFLGAIHPEDRRGAEEAINHALAAHEDYTHEFRIIRPDGSVHWLMGKGRGYYDETGQPVRMHGVVTDVTQRKEAETQLRLQAEKLAEADRRKDEFLAMLAHELRNPLAPLHTEVELIGMRHAKDPRLSRDIAIAKRQIQHMTRLIDDLLDVSRITHGRIELRKERVNLLEAIHNSVESAQQVIGNRHHRLALCLPLEPIWIMADPTRMEQIIVNLLTNAAKYMDPGGDLWLSVEGIKDGLANGEVIIRVQDKGIGISPEMLPRIFDLFVQADQSLDRKQGGLGIGLTLVHRLVEMHGGTIEAHSEGIGKGSEFIIQLPTLSESAGGVCEVSWVVNNEGSYESEGAAPGIEETFLRVLMVDDNVDSAQSLSELLEIWGYPVRIAHDGPAALTAAREFHPDLVLLDIGLPEMNGYEVARLMRADPELKSVLLVALTGYGQEEDRREAERAGFDHHFTKPVDLNAMQKLLEQAMEKKWRAQA